MKQIQHAQKAKKKKKRMQLPFRLNVLFFIVFLLFSALILRLGVIQIVYGEQYRKEVERTENVTVNTPAPRGKIYDRNYQVVVDNEPLHAITYTRTQTTKPSEMIEVAKKLAAYIEKPTERVTERDIKDYWILTNEEKAKEKITEKEWKLFREKKLKDKDIYQLQLERITEEDVQKIKERELEVVAIFREMNSGYALTPQMIKNEGVTDEEYAVVSEHLEELPGVDVTTDWNRQYTYGDTFRTVLGNITSSEEGVPREKLDYYLARDYSRNDRVGKSYIEAQYEDVLRGQKAKIKNVTDKAGNIIETIEVSQGQRGKDIVLTIDMELQKRVEQIIEEELMTMKRRGGTELLDRAFVVMMDPNTGEILSLAGKRYTRDENGKVVLKDYALGTITSAYAMGSAVKGATVLTGFQTGVIQPGTVLIDEPLYIKGTPTKKSHSGIRPGPMNDLKALEMSSNVYMFKTAIAIAGSTYRPHQPLPIKKEAFSIMRRYFNQFGLGVKTGIDLPGEIIGWPGQSTLPGHLLDLAIGQFDVYTPIQMAQYVSTIANGGYRIQPHVVKEIREPISEKDQMGNIIYSFEPKVLNRIDMKTEYIERVREGFYRVMHGSNGTARAFFANAPYDPAGKTGTAQAFYDGPIKSRRMAQTYNLTLVGFAPYNNPEVAFAVVVPWVYQNPRNHYPINNYIGRKILDAYFELKKQRQFGEPSPTEPLNNEEQTMER
ncbi:penicillin-binding protein 2 [Anoxybacillus ayderensis]|uniref:peptidoglycan D,D-transpeptidase FtsI family protein n=1 Tax=Anoxybacillus sp. ST70 TaxID=2864180 RepID=UPI0002FACBBC|nr:penicillin-binding protein 2 [Anoxybacillus sp. ST70]AXM89806.1 penicillin-binding protein 2 [Anoxybacillus ayderensis G10]MBW9217924.1 penicillin-binding protein 2 [Anoxybacillus sp. ST70]THD17189.1 penicillin-binding protein 2 [Anoxybacillus ayderensis]